MDSIWSMIDGRRIHGRVANSAAARDLVPVVLVHGYGMSSKYFVPLAEVLAKEFAVSAPDLPGHGRSETPPKPLDIPALADVLMRWVEQMRLPRVALVAHSMGSQIAVAAALQHPQQIDRLVFIGPAVDPTARSAIKQTKRFVSSWRYEPASLLQVALPDFCRMHVRLVAELRFLLREHTEKKLPQIRQPVMLVRGENDVLSPQRWVDAVTQLTSAQQVAVIPRAGHAVHFSAPSEVAEAVVPFLRESFDR